MLLTTVLATGLTACSAPSSFRNAMMQNATLDDGIQQTYFAHIGEIDTKEGTFSICIQRAVLTGMIAPRGLKWLLVFNGDSELVARYPLPNAEPLWCEGPRIYLFGHGYVPGTSADPRVESLYDTDESPSGNVIDFSASIHRPVITRETAYGSSGGIEDDAWAR